MEELYTLEKDIEAILLNDPFTRADDMLLYLKYLRSIGAAGDLAAGQRIRRCGYEIIQLI